MEIDRKGLKRLAKQRIKVAPTHPMLVTLVYGLVTIGMAMIVSFAMIIPTGVVAVSSQVWSGDSYSPSLGFGAMALPLFMYILMILLSAVLQHGYVAYTLKVADGRESGCGDIFSGFPRVGRVIPMNLALAGFYILWSLAIAVPGMLIIMVLSVLAASLGSVLLMGILMFAFYIGIIVALMLVTMRYLFANHVLADNPAVGPLDAIRRSRVLMRGRSGEGLLLQLSFLGWSLPPIVVYFVGVIGGVVLTVGSNDPLLVGMTVLAAMLLSLLVMIPTMLWLYPYAGTTISLYYRALAPREPVPEEEPAPLPDPNTPWRPNGEQ